MFNTYQDIFNQRGIIYHQAMLQYPFAREVEFKHIIQLAEIEDNQIICDVPSGGCYLRNFIEKPVKIISVETSEAFVQCSQNEDNKTVLMCEDISHIPLVSETVDRVISLAGLHHVNDKVAFYREAYRLLKPKGIFCLADGKAGSKVEKFLNEFVDQYNSLGHYGVFLSEEIQEELESVGFTVNYASLDTMNWQFDSVENMIKYCRLLFGINRGTDEEVLQGIQDYLGFQIMGQSYYLNWELYFVKALKHLNRK